MKLRRRQGRSLLVNLPKDILYQILMRCDVLDHLRCERVCHILKDAVRTKSLWLYNLRNLDRLCSPNIPPHVDPVSLPYSVLRARVLEAIRWRKRVEHGEAHYQRHRRVNLAKGSEEVGVIQSREPKHDETIKLSAGGRFLFVVMEDKSGFEHLKIYDLEDDDACVWTFKAVKKIQAFDFELHNNGSLCVAILDRTGKRTKKCRVQVFELTQGRQGTKSFRAYHSELKIVENSFWDSISLSGQYAILLTSDCVYCIDWRKHHKVGLIRNSEEDSTTAAAVVHGKRLFVVYGNEPNGIWNRLRYSFSLYYVDLAIVFSDCEPEYAVPLMDCSKCSIPLTTAKDDWYLPRVPRPSVYESSWKGDSDGRLYINFCEPYCHVQGNYVQEDPAVFSIVFEPGPEDSSPTLSWDVRPVPTKIAGTSCTTEKDRSGVVSPNGACLVDSWCPMEPVFGGYPYAMSNELVILSMTHGTSGPAKCVKVPEIIQKYIPEFPGIFDRTVFMEPYSNALLCYRRLSERITFKRLTKEEKTSIDIYYPS